MLGADTPGKLMLARRCLVSPRLSMASGYSINIFPLVLETAGEPQFVLVLFLFSVEFLSHARHVLTRANTIRRYDLFSELMGDFRNSYAGNWHRLEHIWVGFPLPHDISSNIPVKWKVMFLQQLNFLLEGKVEISTNYLLRGTLFIRFYVRECV